MIKWVGAAYPTAAHSAWAPRARCQSCGELRTGAHDACRFSKPMDPFV